MNNKITVSEAKQQKKELEESLLVQIKAFEVETGCRLLGVLLHKNQAVGSLPEVYSVELDCTL